MENMLKGHSSSNRVRPDDQASDRGSALVVAAIISVIVMGMGAVTLSFANRESGSSNNDRQRQHAIDAAMAASVVANSALASNAAYAGSGLVTFAGGEAQYEVTVARDTTVTSGIRRIITSYGYAPTKAKPTSTRAVRQVVELDPIGFAYGIFVDGSYSDGSSSSVTGSIYAGGSISPGNAHDYVGNLDAIGSISTGSNQTITGTLHANGSVSVSNTSTVVYGNVYAGGSISTGGIIRDVAQAGGTVSNCAKVQGSCIQHSAPPPVLVQQLPPFTFNAANYSPAPTYPTGSAFVTGVKNRTYTQGVYKISGSASFANNDSLQLTGDMTIFVTGSLTLPGTISGPAGQNVQLTVVVGGSATAPNNLTIPSTVRTLIYTNGSFSASNKLIFTGALYAHGSFSLGANSSITYAPVSAPGFDWTNANPRSFTIRNVSTREITGV
jgi:Tfp pilus assembly protein PilX